MPTGYTDMIDRNPTMTAKQWVMEGLARAFGMCVTLRDDAFDLSEEQIKKKLVESEQSEINYHQKELNKAKKKCRTLATKTNKEWLTLWLTDDNKREEENKKSVVRANKLSDRHERVRDGLNRILASDKVHEVTKSIAKFGIEQLDLVVADGEPYIREPITLEGFIKEAISSSKRDIKYHTEELAKAKQRGQERINLYARLKEDIRSVFQFLPEGVGV
jgi:hypothetical protein